MSLSQARPPPRIAFCTLLSRQSRGRFSLKPWRSQNRHSTSLGSAALCQAKRDINSRCTPPPSPMQIPNTSNPLFQFPRVVPRRCQPRCFDGCALNSTSPSPQRRPQPTGLGWHLRQFTPLNLLRPSPFWPSPVRPTLRRPPLPKAHPPNAPPRTKPAIHWFESRC
jgi:hypothetical protein